VCTGTGVALKNLTFTAKVMFTLPFPGTISVWDNALFNANTNINGTSIIPAYTWTTVTATINDNGSPNNQFGINFAMPYDLTQRWSADIWLDDITIK
jgi:hypothetical protein